MISVHFNRQCKVRNITALTGKWLCSWYLCIIFFDEFKHFCFLFKNQVSKYILLLERLSLDPLISEWTLCMLCDINHKAHKNVTLTINSHHKFSYITLKITGTHVYVLILLIIWFLWMKEHPGKMFLRTTRGGTVLTTTMKRSLNAAWASTMLQKRDWERCMLDLLTQTPV